MLPTDVAGLAGLMLAWAAVLVMLAGRTRPRPSRRMLAGVAVLALVLAWLPARGVPLIEYLRGVTGDLSVTAVCLLGHALWSRLRAPPAPATGAVQWLVLRLVILAGALLLYPASLGTGGWAPYQWGFGSPVMLGVLLAGTLVALACGYLRLVVAVTAAVLAWVLGLQESRNLWDYLLDPMLSSWALVSLVISLLAGAWARLPMSRRRPRAEG